MEKIHIGTLDYLNPFPSPRNYLSYIYLLTPDIQTSMIFLHRSYTVSEKDKDEDSLVDSSA